MFCKFLGVFWGRGLVALCERRELITSDVRAITQADARDSGGKKNVKGFYYENHERGRSR